MSAPQTTDLVVSLRACPFCGSDYAPMVTGSSEYHDIDCECADRSHDDSYAVVCDASSPGGRGGCGASGGFSLTKAEAVDRWNRRVLT